MPAGITATLLQAELGKRGIDVTRIEKGRSNIFMFDYNGATRFISGVAPDLSSSTSRLICNHKDLTEQVAVKLGIPIPAGLMYTNEHDAAEFLRTHKRIVVKPTNGAHGNGVSTNITTLRGLRDAVKYGHAASPKYKKLLLQQQISGSDYRVLVMNGEVTAVAERVPAMVMGDGKHSIAALIRLENKTNTKRGKNYEKSLNFIDTAAATTFLGKRLKEVPKAGQHVQVVGTANIGTGGSAINRTGDVPDGIEKAACKLAKAIGAFTCGVDFMYDRETGEWYLIEMNGSPSFGLHAAPSEGDAIDVTKLFVDALFKAYDSH